MSSFEENIKDIDIKPNEDIVNAIDSSHFPFSQNFFFENDSVTLATEEYKRCYEIYRRRLKDKMKSTNFNVGGSGYIEIMDRFMSVKNRISFKESYHIEDLEILAEKVIRDIYGIPEEMELEGYIRPDEKDQDFDTSSSSGGKSVDIPEDRMVEIYMAAQKRVILNTLAHGSSVHIWKSSFHLVKKELDNMDDGLMDLYNEYTSIVSIMLWMYSPHDMKRMILNNTAIKQGHNKVTWSDDEEGGEEDFEEEFEEDTEEEYQKFLDDLKKSGEYEEGEPTPIGTSIAINFPVLLHEINKSAFEILSMKSIPSDFNKKELAAYYAIADEYSEEVWHYYLGPTLWVNLLPVMKETDMSIADVYEIFEHFSYEKLAEFCILVMEEREKAVEMLLVMEERLGEKEDE